ncbi:hypothetical protein F2P81_009505 [Scophthalmus maximus]|uniref:Uncharacterized protein n=1 Tax=Scophthalmus maximus TaxID=52904 RepID=A0A6A4T7I0_SCOMX|nr:hypothetical protein F2P81_009505 [Scophthalmus maximus]
MPKKDSTIRKVTTPVDVVKKNNPLVCDIAKLSGKWHKRWPDIEQPWPVEGTLNPDVNKTMQVLVSTYKVNQKKGKKGEKHREKRQIELDILQLFENEGQKLIKAAKDNRDIGAEEIAKDAKVTEKLMAEINTPFSHTDPVKKPPPYEKEVKFKDIYPQLPVISQEGDYCIRDEDDQIIEIGQAETTIKMNPSSKSKKKTTRLETKGRLRIRKMGSRDDDDQSDSEEIMGGYDPVVRWKLERAERRGDEIWKKRNRGDYTSDESENGDSDGDLVNEGASCSRGFYPAMYSTRIEEVERSIVWIWISRPNQKK